MQEELTKTAIRGALCLTLGALAWPCGAVTLGEAQVRSALGEPLDLRIPLKTAAGESIERSCFTMLPDNDAGLPGVGDGSISIERTRGAAALRLRTFTGVMEPAVALKVRAACAAATEPEFTREYVLLLDPRPASPTAGMSSAMAAPPVTATPRGIIATLMARIGDTLESLARAIVGRSPAGRAEYIAAMRAANPALQSLGEQDPIPAGTAVALPDLRIAAPATVRARAPRESALTPAPHVSAPAAAPRERAPAAAPRESAAPAPARAPAERARPAPAPIPAPPAATQRRAPEFVLRLSAPQVDMSRSGRLDEAARQKLRDRQLVLDADDQVSALLAMRNSLKQLESRVAELQLKLAAMPPSLAGLTPPPEKAAAPAPAAKPPVVREPAPPVIAAAPPPPNVPTLPAISEKPAPATTPPIETAPAPSTPAVGATAPIATTAPPAAGIASPAAEEPAKAPAAASPERRPSSRAVARTGASDGLAPWLWALVALLVALALWLALRISRRKREEQFYVEQVEPELGDQPLEEAPPVAQLEEPVPAPRSDERPALASDAPLATRFAENSGELRRRYIEERFPEIANRAVALEDPASVVKAARLFYEDGALPRAVELLQFAIEDRPAEAKPWLALFEIFRLERLTGQYAELAERFRAQHGATEHWRKVRFFGREIDPGNPLYREESVNTLETIGPREAKRLAGANASYDPIAENWLAAPMDFENEVLANDLRRALMAEAKLTEQQLAPNPMPALRNIEMFTVA